MTNYGHIWLRISNTDQFSTIAPKRLCITYDASQCHIVHNMASTGPVWPVVDNGGLHWSRISSLNELVHFKSELSVLGLVYQVMDCKAL